jgi:hypothetical protein
LSALALAGLAVGLSLAVLTPGLSGIRAGYRLHALKAEERRLLDERRTLELEEARLLSPARLRELAATRSMSAPAPGQVIRLDSPAADSLAMNVKK